MDVLLEKYGKGGSLKKKFGVSSQHYSFVVKSFVELVKHFGKRGNNTTFYWAYEQYGIWGLTARFLVRFRDIAGEYQPTWKW